MKTATLNYSEALVREAISAYWRRKLGWSYPLTLGLVAIVFFYCVVSGDASWITGVAGVILVIGVAMAATFYRVHFRGAMMRLRRMRRPEARMEMDERTLRLSVEEASVALPWNAVTELWRFEKFWLIFYSPAQFNILPLADLDDDTKAFIAEQVQRHGGKLH